MGFRSAFSYYGAKSKLLDCYPAPKHDLIIEPFAGGACYSLRHGEGRSVWLNDLDPGVFAMWTFIRDAVPEWLARIPDRVEPGQRASTLVAGAPAALVSILQAEANQGTQGARGVHDQVTSMGAKCWPRIKDKLQWAHEKVQGWQITNLPYELVGAMHLEGYQRATYFIDPPYDNPAGRRYRQQVVDYNALAQWTLARKGQIIVCENVGAQWLPFEPLVTRRGIRSRYQRSNASEAIYTFDRA
jgi:site-specific DNA-adenine methylase